MQNPELSPLTAKAQQSMGRAARKQLSRGGFGRYTLNPLNRDPVELLRQQEATRIAAFLPLRHQRMAQSAFAFYRGTALLMAHDLATDRPQSGINVQLCGDAHLANFGFFAAPNRSVLFDINDFDETHPGPFEWDLARLSVSLALALRDNGLDSRDREARLVTQLITSYQAAMHRFSDMAEMDIWNEHPDERWIQKTLRSFSNPKAQAAFSGYLSKARARGRWTSIVKLTDCHQGVRRFLDLPPLLIRIPHGPIELERQQGLFNDYLASLDRATQTLLSRYQIIDIGHKLVGVGSVGLAAYVYLLQGRRADDLLVLQAKESVASVIAPFSKTPWPQPEGLRIVSGQRIMQASGDLALGWLRGPLGRDFYIRQLRDMKYQPDLSRLKLSGFETLAGLCGMTLARAHARSGRSSMIAAYLGQSPRFAHGLMSFTEAYLDQVAEDFARFKGAIEQGELAASEGDILPPTFIANPWNGILIEGRQPPGTQPASR